MDERERRVVANEALFREVNERIEGINAAFGELAGGTFAVVCECGSATCIEQMTLPVPEYERVRADSTVFVVRPGHELPDLEDVVARAPDYVLVRKATTAARRLAEETDDRS